MIVRVWKLLSSTFIIWDQANSSRMSAAMTYYTMLSLAPLLMIAIAIAGFVYDGQIAESEIIEQVSFVTTPAIAETVAGLIKNATAPGSGILASSISLLVLFYGASGVFSQLYDTFNDIWQVPIESRTGFLFTVQKRLIGVGMVLTAGLVLLCTLILGSVISYLNEVMHEFPRIASWLSLADRGLSYLLMPIIFALIFRFFPAAKIEWRDVWPAGVLTAFLVAASRYLTNLYLQFSTTSEVYGAAGSLVVLLIWVYMTGLVVFFGAAFSHAWSKTFGSRASELEKLPSKNQPAASIETEPPPSSVTAETDSTHSVSEDPVENSPLILHRRIRER